MKHVVLATKPNGMKLIFAYSRESAALKAQKIIDTYTDWDTQVIPVSKYKRADFSVYS